MTTTAPVPQQRRPRPARTSDLLAEFAAGITGPRVTLNEIVTGLGDRGLGVLIAIFAIPNLVPAIVPFGNAVFGIPIIVFAFQLMLGLRRLYLPKRLGNISMETQTFRAAAIRISRALDRKSTRLNSVT